MPETFDVVLFGMISRHPGKNRGGVSASVRRLANALVEIGTRVAIITSQGACTADWRAGLHHSVRVFPRGRLSRLQLTAYIAFFLLRNRPTSVVAFDLRAGLIAARARRFTGARSRLVWSPRVVIGEQARYASQKAKRRLIRELRAVHASSAVIIAISRGLAADLSAFAGIPPSAITTIYNPIIDADFHRAAAAQCPSQPMLPTDRKLVVSSGRLVTLKDYGTLIRAFKRVNDALPSFLLILGEGPERTALERLIQALGLTGCVALPGYVTNPLPYMRRANVFALSSRHEGFGNVLAEALALGTAVVSTDCPSGPAEILDGGRYGELTPVGDHKAMADALLRALKEPPAVEHQRAGALPYEAHRIARQYRAAVLG